MMIIETSDDDYAALRRGIAPRSFRLPDTPIAQESILEMFVELAALIRPVFTPTSWMLLEEGEVVGLCVVTKQPVNGEVDIGYGVAPGRRNRGIAGRAIGEVVAWALARPDVRR